ncbi:hypothetical protein C8J57DRAFT_1251320 [Mycena rebaudengoi]|nr:hypothetical protein C8J57DRAFT_1251320 [Mycena rebaudengoi]
MEVTLAFRTWLAQHVTTAEDEHIYLCHCACLAKAKLLWDTVFAPDVPPMPCYADCTNLKDYRRMIYVKPLCSKTAGKLNPKYRPAEDAPCQTSMMICLWADLQGKWFLCLSLISYHTMAVEVTKVAEHAHQQCTATTERSPAVVAQNRGPHCVVMLTMVLVTASRSASFRKCMGYPKQV